MSYKSDIEIAREAKKQPIQQIGEKLGIGFEDLLPFGHDKAKVSQLNSSRSKEQEGWQADPCDGDQPDPCGRRQDHHDRGSG